MKTKQKLSLLILFLLTLSAAPAFAQKHEQGKKEQVVIDAKGGIYDHDGTKLGFIDKDNIVRNANGQKVYFIDRDGNVIDANGKKLGKAQKNGNYYNLEGQSVLTVKDKNEAMCEILDPAGHKLGNVHKNYKLHACAAHCLAMQHKKSQKH